MSDYVTDGKELYEVVGERTEVVKAPSMTWGKPPSKRFVSLVNCRTGWPLEVEGDAFDKMRPVALDPPDLDELARDLEAWGKEAPTWLAK